MYSYISRFLHTLFVMFRVFYPSIYLRLWSFFSSNKQNAIFYPNICSSDICALLVFDCHLLKHAHNVKASCILTSTETELHSHHLDLLVWNPKKWACTVSAGLVFTWHFTKTYYGFCSNAIKLFQWMLIYCLNDPVAVTQLTNLGSKDIFKTFSFGYGNIQMSNVFLMLVELFFQG